MTNFSLPFIFGLLLLYRFPAQAAVDLAISGSGSLIDTESDTESDIETEGSGKLVGPVSRPATTTQKPSSFRGGNSIVLPDDEDEYIVLPEGSATGESTTVTNRIDTIGGSGSLVECSADGMWCWCLDENGNERPETMRKFGRAELELTNCNPSPISRETVSTTTTKSPTTVSTESTTIRLPDRMVCSTSGLYCWCLDIYGTEIPGTRMYMYGTKLSPYVTCPLGETTTAVPSTVKQTENTTPMIGALLPERMVCDDTSSYCWCLDLYGNEIAGTKIYMSGTVPYDLTCPTIEPGLGAIHGIIDGMPFTTPKIDWQHVDLPDGVACDSMGLYCWCIDRDGNEIPDTRIYRFGPTPSPGKSCPTGDSTRLLPSDTDITLVAEETTTVKSRKTTPHEPPYDVHIEDDIHPKTDKPAVTSSVKPKHDKDDKEDEIGWGAGQGGRSGVDRTDLPPSYPFFTHPGILAAIIGGGVVALLSAMLLIMFIIYRMRKKDEGSYPLDPDSKPQRLHTYTRAPNKEFYA